MNYLKRTLAGGSILILLCTASFVGCKKSELSSNSEFKAQTKSLLQPDTIPDEPLPELGPDIYALKTYMASQVNVGINDITYDELTQQFFVDGLPQISLGDLSKSYEQNNNVDSAE